MRKKQLRDTVHFLERENARLNGENDLLASRLIELTNKPAPSNKPKLTGTQVFEIRNKFHFGGLTQKALAAAYGVNPATISRIVRGVYHR